MLKTGGAVPQHAQREWWRNHIQPLQPATSKKMHAMEQVSVPLEIATESVSESVSLPINTVNMHVEHLGHPTLCSPFCYELCCFPWSLWVLGPSRKLKPPVNSAIPEAPGSQTPTAPAPRLCPVSVPVTETSHPYPYNPRCCCCHHPHQRCHLCPCRRLCRLPQQ